MADEQAASVAAIETTSTPETPTPSESGGYPSDDEILDGSPAAETPAEDTDKGEEKPAAEEAKAVTDGEGKETEKKDEADRPYSEHIEPEELKRTFKAHPQLRDAWYAEKAFREVFPTVAEAREFKSVFPTLDIAKRAAEHQSFLLELDKQYATDPAGFAARLQKGNPEAFYALLRDSRDVAYQADPKAYRDNYAEPAVRDAVGNLADLAAQHGDEDLAAAVKIIEDRLGWSGGESKGRLPDDDPRIREYEQLKAQQSQYRQEAFNGFSSSADRAVDEGIAKAVQEAVGTPSGMSEKALARIVKEVAEEIRGDIRSRAQLLALYDAKKRAGNLSKEHHDETVNFLLTHAKQYVPAKVRVHLNEWTNEILRTNAADRERQKAVPARKEVGGGVTSTPTPKIPLKPDHDFYRKHSDDAILNL